jgi:MFS family permease
LSALRRLRGFFAGGGAFRRFAAARAAASLGFFTGGAAASGNFRLFWLGQAVSQAGSAISLVALPLIAVIAVGATPAQMGLLIALETAPAILFTLPVGVLGDHVDRRRILVFSDIARIAVISCVPAAAMTGRLDFTVLAAVAFLMGSLGVVFSVTKDGFIAQVVDDDSLVTGGYQRLESSSSAASIAGPGIGGALFGLLGTAGVIVLDAVSYAVSAVSLLLMAPSRPPAKATVPHMTATSLGSEFLAGFRLMAGDRVLRDMAIATGLQNFGTGIIIALFVIWATRDNGMSAAAFGVMYSVTSLGFLVGVAAAGKADRRLGAGRAMTLATAATCVAMLLVPMASPGLGIVFLAASRVLISIALMTYNILLVSISQQRAGPAMRGRIAGSLQFIAGSAVPVGSVAGGLLASAAGTQVALWCAAIIPVAGVILLATGPVWRLRDIPPAEDAAAISAAG